MDVVRLTGLDLSCIVGLRPAERRRRQRIRLSIELRLDLSRAAESCRIAHTADYSVVADEVSHLLRFREYRLIETATEEIAAMLLGTHPVVSTVVVTLEKPEALRGRALHGSVTIERKRREPVVKDHGFGREEILLETSEATLSLFHVDPGKAPSPLAELHDRRLGWLVGGQLGTEHALHEPSVFARLLGETNRGTERATVFVCALREPERPT